MIRNNKLHKNAKDKSFGFKKAIVTYVLFALWFLLYQ